MPFLTSRYQCSSAVLVIAVLVFGILSGCRRDTSNAKRYELQGKVLSVEKEKHLVTISHEAVKDFMEAMTMPFVVREEWVFDQAKPGHQIKATLVVDETESWLENVVIIESNGESSGEGSSAAVGPNTGDEVPDFALINQNNQPIHIRQYQGKALLLTFIYTRCPLPEYCTLMSNNFARIDQELQKNANLYDKTRLLSITIDPDYDRPAVLRSYGASHTGRFGDETFSHWTFATGSKEQIKAAADYFGLQYFPEKDQITHGLRTVLIGPDGKVHKVYRGNEWKPEEVLKDIDAVAR